MTPAVFHFQVPFSNVSAKVDKDAGIIRGVAIITGDVVAKGHDLHVDDKTLEQVAECGQAKGKVQVKLDHKSGVNAICGYISNFRRERGKVLGDWHLLKTHEEYEKIIEKAERMPDCFGLSAAFAGPPKGEKNDKGGKSARCTELLAVDCVTMPAANPSGLFSALVDIPGVANQRNMAGENNTTTEPSIAELMKAFNGFREEVTKRLDGIEQRQEQGDEFYSPEEVEAMSGMTDEQLAEIGVTRAEVQDALAQLNEATATHESPADTSSGANAPVPAAVATEMAAMKRVITQLQAKVGVEEENAEVAEVMRHFDILETKFDEVLEEVAQKDLQIAALQRSLRLNGAKAATAGESVRMFEEVEDEEGLTKFEQLTRKHYKALLDKGTKPGAAKLGAIRLAQKEDPRSYGEFRAKGGAIELAGE